MGTDPVWLFVELRLRRVLPRAHAASTLGDLAEDYDMWRISIGPVRARVRLLQESASLVRAYRIDGLDEGRLMLLTDIRHAARRFVARLRWSLVCVALLGLGIGVPTAMFSAVDALILRPAPFRDPGRLIEQTFFSTEPAVLQAWRTSGLFDVAEGAVLRTWASEPSAPSEIRETALVTPGIFDMLGVAPLRGRTFSGSGDSPVSSDEVILSEGLWRAAFVADPSVLGRRVRVGATSAVVVGIMPNTFRFPTPTTVAWQPLELMSKAQGPFTIFGRVTGGVPLEHAEVRVQAISRTLARIPDAYRGDLPVSPLGRRRPVDGFTQQALWLLFGGSILVFLVLAANVGSLLLASLGQRRREFGTCTALGATRARLIRQATVEQSVIGALAVVFGLVVAWGLTHLVPTLFLDQTLNPINIDRRALAVAAGFGVATVVLCGILPAWFGTRSPPLASLRELQVRHEGTSSRHLVIRGLVIVEIAVASSLVLGSAVLARSFVNLVTTERGLAAAGVVRVQILDLDEVVTSREEMLPTLDLIARTLSQVPEISTVVLSRELPPNPGAVGTLHLGSPGSQPDPAASVPSDRYRVSADFFAFYDIPIVRGRTFQAGEPVDSVIVSQGLVQQLWPLKDPLGQLLSVDRSPRALRVVGVANEIRLPSLDDVLDRPEHYTPLGDASRTLYANFRCRAVCPTDMALQRSVASVHPALRVQPASSADDRYLKQLQLPRAMVEIGGVLTAVSVLTAAAGLFSLLTYVIGGRRRDFGIRMALGASAREIRSLVFRDACFIAAAGITGGVLGGWLVARVLAAFQYGVTAGDPLTWASVLVTMGGATVAAAWPPACHANRIDLVRLIREE